MPSSGDTLSLYNLGQATGQGVTNISLGTAEGSPTSGETIGLSKFSPSSVGNLEGYTYAVENTAESYELAFTTGSGVLFDSRIANRSENFTWSVPTGTKISLNTNSGKAASFNVGNMTDVATQTTLQNVETHTIRVVWNDGFNDHVSGHGANKDKTVYSVDSYDGHTALCLTSDSPITKADGTVVEVGELEEGDLLKGFAITGLDADSDSNYLQWSTENLSVTPKDVKVVNVVYSFSQRYYSVNGGEINATSEHPMLVKDSESGNYKFKEIFRLNVGDCLIKGTESGVEEIEITSIEPIVETTEIVSIDVEEQDTYMVNGYITHNKGGNSHTDFSGPAAPTSLNYSSPSITWTAPAGSGDTGITAYDIQIDNNSDFSSPIVNETEWSDGSIEVNTLLSAGTYYCRVRAIESGLPGTWSSTLTFTR